MTDFLQRKRRIRWPRGVRPGEVADKFEPDVTRREARPARPAAWMREDARNMLPVLRAQLRVAKGSERIEIRKEIEVCERIAAHGVPGWDEILDEEEESR